LSNSAARIVAVCRSESTGVSKTPVDSGLLEVCHGLAGDAHAGLDAIREVSLLASESIAKMNATGFNFKPGDFAENLTTVGIDLVSLPVGTRMEVGREVILEVSQIGKKCHTGCAIFQQAGKCIMPKEGIFARVIKGGTVMPGHSITLLKH
jgi:MOSC domain-containing protein YiiM